MYMRPGDINMAVHRPRQINPPAGGPAGTMGAIASGLQGFQQGVQLGQWTQDIAQKWFGIDLRSPRQKERAGEVERIMSLPNPSLNDLIKLRRLDPDSFKIYSDAVTNGIDIQKGRLGIEKLLDEKDERKRAQAIEEMSFDLAGKLFYANGEINMQAAHMLRTIDPEKLQQHLKVGRALQAQTPGRRAVAREVNDMLAGVLNRLRHMSEDQRPAAWRAARRNLAMNLTRMRGQAGSEAMEEVLKWAVKDIDKMFKDTETGAAVFSDESLDRQLLAMAQFNDMLARFGAGERVRTAEGIETGTIPVAQMRQMVAIADRNGTSGPAIDAMRNRLAQIDAVKGRLKDAGQGGAQRREGESMSQTADRIRQNAQQQHRARARNLFGGGGGERQRRQNADGTQSSELSVTVQDPRTPGKWINIPSMYGGQEVSEQDALRRIQEAGYRDPETGQPIQSFDSMEAATQAARERSASLGRRAGGAAPAVEPPGGGGSGIAPDLPPAMLALEAAQQGTLNYEIAPAPRDPAQRQPGTVYQLPDGRNAHWDGTQWAVMEAGGGNPPNTEPPSGMGAQASLTPVEEGEAQRLDPSLNTGGATGPQGEMPLQLVEAVTQAESGGDPNARSSAGAIGLMQVRPDTAMDPGFGAASVFDIADQQGVSYSGKTKQEAERLLRIPEVNSATGSAYLEALVRRYEGDTKKALVAYNWGPENADKWDGNDASLPEETRTYVRRVMAQIGGDQDAARMARAARNQLSVPRNGLSGRRLRQTIEAAMKQYGGDAQSWRRVLSGKISQTARSIARHGSLNLGTFG